MGRAETTTYWNAHALGASVCFFGKVFGGALRGGACCRFVEAQECSGEVRRSECPNGHRIPARGETPGMPHNRSVLKERRIHPGCSDLFYGGRVPGLALGISASTGGSAGSALHSQGTWGQARRSRGRARGIRMSTFLCSLRPRPAAAGNLFRHWFVTLLGNGSTAGGTALERRYFDGRAPAASRDRRTAQRASRRGVGMLARRDSRWGS